MRNVCPWFVTLLVCSASLRATPVTLFSKTDAPNSIRSSLAQGPKIDFVVPTWCAGEIWSLLPNRE